eukprot:6781533-Ditylum_brightwellii.AAC.1
MHNKQLGWVALASAENLEGVADEQYRSRKKKAADIQVLNTWLFYDYVLLERTPSTSTFINLVSKYNLVVHSIASLALQQ